MTTETTPRALQKEIDRQRREWVIVRLKLTTLCQRVDLDNETTRDILTILEDCEIGSRVSNEQ